MADFGLTTTRGPGDGLEMGGKVTRMRAESPADALPRSLEAGSVVRDLAAGEVLFRQGDRAAAIYQVDSGRLRPGAPHRG